MYLFQLATLRGVCAGCTELLTASSHFSVMGFRGARACFTVTETSLSCLLRGSIVYEQLLPSKQAKCATRDVRIHFTRQTSWIGALALRLGSDFGASGVPSMNSTTSRGSAILGLRVGTARRSAVKTPAF